MKESIEINYKSRNDKTTIMFDGQSRDFYEIINIFSKASFSTIRLCKFLWICEIFVHESAIIREIVLLLLVHSLQFLMIDLS